MFPTQRTFRVFVSSTFSDFLGERTALQQTVFPAVRDLCLRRGACFQAVDLRWGVSEGAARDQQTLDICLEELRRCQEASPRPCFLLLLGQRYGWRPLPTRIEASEFETLLTHLPPEGACRLSTWYRRDDNAVPPVHVLLPRQAEFVEGRR